MNTSATMTPQHCIHRNVHRWCRFKYMVLVSIAFVVACEQRVPHHGDIIIPGVMFASDGYGRGQAVYSLHHAQFPRKQIVPLSSEGSNTVTSLTVLESMEFIYGSMRQDGTERWFAIDGGGIGLRVETFDRHSELELYIKELGYDDISVGETLRTYAFVHSPK